MLVAKLHIETVLKLGQVLVLVARNGHGGRLVAGGVDLDLVFQRVVIEVVCRVDQLATIQKAIDCVARVGSRALVVIMFGE